jgi:threo-3-hydroxy-L-aspartate ammonia-lyase
VRRLLLVGRGLRAPRRVDRQYTGVQHPERTIPTPELVDLGEIRAAAERIRGVVVRTPLLPFGSPLPGDRFGRTRAWLKPESLQPIGAFKLRGAYNAVASLTQEALARGVVAHSSGNHAQGVARAARLLGTRAVVVMPRGAPALKVERVRADGAEIVFVGADPDERAEKAHELAEERGLDLVPSYDDRRIIAGQGTAGLEIVQGVEEGGDAAIAPPGMPFSVLVPVGGGGLSGGVATAVKSLRPEARVFGVEPELAADATESLQAGRIVKWASDRAARTIADGLRTTSLSPLTFAHLQRWLDGMLTVSEAEIGAAMAAATDGARLVLEPSGAVSLAAWLFHARELPEDGPVICLLSGGNVDVELYRRLVDEGRSTGRSAADTGAPV